MYAFKLLCCSRVLRNWLYPLSVKPKMTQNAGVCRLSQVLCRHQLHHSAHQTSLFRGQSIDPTNAVSVRLPPQAVVMTKLTVKSRLRNSRWPAPPICLRAWPEKIEGRKIYLHGSVQIPGYGGEVVEAIHANALFIQPKH